MVKGVKPRVLKISLYLVEATSIPLMVLLTIYLLTGYEMMVPKYRFIPGASVIHTDRVLRIAFATLAILHCYAGLTVMLERRVKSRYAKIMAEVLITLLIITFAMLIALYEISLN